MKKQILAAIIASLILPGALSGCGDSGSPSSSEGKPSSAVTDSSGGGGSEDGKPQSNIKPGEVVEISMSILDRGSIPAELGSYSDNGALDYMNEELAPLGVKVSAVPVPRAQSRDKMNAMIAAGTAPDILWEFSRPWMNQLRVQKVILPIEDIIEKYSTSYKAYYEEHKDLMDPYLRMDDGLIYAFSSLRSANALPTAAAWYRKDLLDEVGAAVPTTLEEVINVSKKVQEKHSDIVPIAASYLHYLNIIKGTYGLSSTTEVLSKEGDLIHPIFSDNYKDAMEMARRLYQEKITDQEYLVDTTSARQQQLWTSGQALFFFNTSGTPGGTKELMQTVTTAQPYPLLPLKSDYGQFMLTPQSATRFYVMLNNTMDEKKQEACIRMLDWTIDGGWKIISYGREGVQYNLTPEGLRQAIPQAPSWPYGEFALLTQEVFKFGQSRVAGVTDLDKELGGRSDQGMLDMMSYPIASPLPYDFSSDAYSEFSSNFNAKMSEVEAKMVSETNYTVDDGIKELQGIYKEMGGEEVWQDKVSWYEANKDTLASFAESYDSYKSELLKNTVTK